MATNIYLIQDHLAAILAASHSIQREISESLASGSYTKDIAAQNSRAMSLISIEAVHIADESSLLHPGIPEHLDLCTEALDVLEAKCDGDVAIAVAQLKQAFLERYSVPNAHINPADEDPENGSHDE